MLHPFSDPKDLSVGDLFKLFLIRIAFMVTVSFVITFIYLVLSGA